MIFLVGIDDTDTLETRGTGFHARQMAAEIEAAGVGRTLGITRHQNFVHPEIKYTSHNSSACLRIESEDEIKLKELCRDFLLRIAPEGSDVGLCVVPEKQVSDQVINWGLDAKRLILFQEDALKLAFEEQIYLEGLTGTHLGVIGALAAVGLRKSGNDGRFIWLKGKKELREIISGVYSVNELKEEVGIEQIVDKEGKLCEENEPVHVHDWFRPVMKDNKVTLIVEKQADNGQHFWQIADRDYVRARY